MVMQKRKMTERDKPGPQDSKVSMEEKQILADAADHSPNGEEEELRKAIPDNVDEDGEPLNEVFSYKDLSASDLDIPDDYEDEEEEELGKIPRDEH
jgi:hypothetical protein